ncbi:hypothetical protein ACFFJX_01930 [Pseudarcicella hirudinis]|uniref:hypothetical protein n=1 Tax=Pseudarcicella hirudinis TaxID=1079859 RepID=UPI0035EFE044
MSILTFSSAFAQRRNTTTEKTNDDNDDNYTSSSLFGLTTGTNSGLLGGFMYRKTFITAKKSENQQYHYINLELVNVKHYREYSSSNTTSGRNFIDGKINYLFAVRPQYGRLISLFKKSPEGGVTINGIIAAGPTIGLLKPYFVEITYLDATTNRAKYVSVPNAADLTVNYPRAQVAGEGGFLKVSDK